MNSAQIKAMVEDEFEELVEIRRDLHMHPELSEHEERTEKAICTQLDKLGIPYEAGVAGHGIIATVGPKDAKYGIAIRADIDALPITECTGLPYASVNKGVMHACGHDIHTTVLLGAAKIFKAMESELKGAVKLFFQPAEETIGGAERMIAHDGLNSPKIKRVMGMHVDPTVPTGCIHLAKSRMNASTTELIINVNGVACHGAHPDQGIDAIVVASHIVLALQTISSRFAAPALVTLTLLPSIKISPLSIFRTPKMHSISSVRPAPSRPARPRTSPSCTQNDTSFTAFPDVRCSTRSSSLPCLLVPAPY